MSPFEAPKIGSVYTAKYIRIDNELWQTKRNNLNTKHAKQAQKDGILEKFLKARKADPNSVYAGAFTVLGNVIYVNRQSDRPTLSYSPTEKGYQLTRELFRSLNPQFKIEKEEKLTR